MKLPSAEQLRALEAEDPELFRAIVEKIDERSRLLQTPNYVEGLFYWQKKFLADPSKKKAAQCSRRAGKSTALAVFFLDGGRADPGGISVYIAGSKNLARLILGSALEELEAKYKIGLRMREIDNQLFCIMPNGHRIWLAGCKDSAEIDKFRGLKYRRAAVDEAQAHGSYIKELVEDVLEPALVDKDGELVLTGTPSPIPAGYFFEATTGAGVGKDSAAQWSTHSWTLVHNPHIQIDKISQSEREQELLAAQSPGYANPRSVAYLKKKLLDNNWDALYPTFRREWLGEWVLDVAALVFPYDPGKNKCHTKDVPKNPEDRWTYVLGIDIGFVDATAFTVGAIRYGHPEIYLLHSEKQGRMIPSRVAAHIERLSRRWNFDKVVMDVGGIGKGYAEECNEKFGMSIEPARKRDKRAFIEVMYGEMVSGNLKVDPRECTPLLQEMSNLTWEEGRERWTDRFEDHCTDSAVYCVRELITEYRPKFHLSPLTPEQEMDESMARHKEKVMRQQQQKFKRDMRHGLMRSKLGKSIMRGDPMW